MEGKKQTAASKLGAAVNKKSFVKVKFLLSPTSKFKLAYNVGEEGAFEEKQAAELVQAKYAEYVK